MSFISKYHKVFALFLFATISIIFFGSGVINHLNSMYSGTGTDKYIYIWSMGWWPHALLHQLNPFIPTVVWAPEGTNLAKATAIPGLAIAFMPLTLLFGAVVSYNLLAIFSPAMAAWGAYLLGCYILKEPRHALIIGYFYGFSSFMVAQMMGHLTLVAPAFFIPIMILLLLRWLDNSITTPKCIIFLTLCLSSVFLISPEILITFTFWGSISYLLALYFFPNLRPRLIQFIRIIVIAYLATVILLSPYLYFFFADTLMGNIGHGAKTFSNDLLNFFVPDQLLLLSNKSTQKITSLFTGNASEWNSYLGLGLIFILILFAKQFWQTNVGKFLLIVSGILAIASLGPVLHIAGIEVFAFPWGKLFTDAPILKLSLPSRLGLFSSLPIAFCVALWFKNSHWKTGGKMVTLLIAVAFLFPTFNASRPNGQAANKPGFFYTELYKNYLTPQDITLMIPYFNHSTELLWQVDTNFYFKSAGGYLGEMPSLYQNDAVAHKLYSYNKTPADTFTKKELLDFMNRHHITVAILADPAYAAWKPLLQQINNHPKEIGGVVLYRIPHTITSGKTLGG